jgi:hypothetical protein
MGQSKRFFGEKIVLLIFKMLYQQRTIIYISILLMELTIDCEKSNFGISIIKKT